MGEGDTTKLSDMPARVANLKGNIGDTASMRGKVEESVQDSTYRDRKIIVYIFLVQT